MNAPGLLRVLRDFAAIFGLFAAVVSVFAVANQFGLDQIFWVVFGLALIVALSLFGFRVLAPRVRRTRELVELGRKHSTLLTTLATLQTANDQLTDDLRVAKTSVEDALNAGIREGRLRVVGEIRGSRVKGTLAPISRAVVGEEFIIAAAFTGTDTRGLMGSHWYLVVSGLLDIKAVLRVSSFSGATVRLVIQEFRDGDFMKTFITQAASDPSIPRQLEIQKRDVKQMSQLLEEG